MSGTHISVLQNMCTCYNTKCLSKDWRTDLYQKRPSPSMMPSVSITYTLYCVVIGRSVRTLPLSCDLGLTCWHVTLASPVDRLHRFNLLMYKPGFTCWVQSGGSWEVSRCRSSWRRPDPPYTADSATYCFLLTSPLSGIISDTPD